MTNEEQVIYLTEEVRRLRLEKAGLIEWANQAIELIRNLREECPEVKLYDVAINQLELDRETLVWGQTK
jgi:hypothetical protein